MTALYLVKTTQNENKFLPLYMQSESEEVPDTLLNFIVLNNSGRM